MSLGFCFSKVIRNGLIKKAVLSPLGSVTARYSSLWEPDYLILAKTKTPEYDYINVQIKGFDFASLEQYQSLIHRIAKLMDLDVVRTWASPQQDLKISNFKPRSTVVNQEYKLKLYERNVQVVDVKSHVMPLFLEAIITACPPGIRISVHEHEEDMDEIRYIPDYEVIEKEKLLEDLKKDSKKKK